jgi:hypothetical protein
MGDFPGMVDAGKRCRDVVMTSVAVERRTGGDRWRNKSENYSSQVEISAAG